MPEPYFQFKRFRVHHSSAFKVGTDGVLLGAWAQVHAGASVLDIGTGSGLIALMMAQKGARTVHAIDVDPVAAAEAAKNFMQSSFGGISGHACPLHLWQPSGRQGYDLIISNPPFFSRSTPAATDTRHRARHTESLTPTLLFSHAAPLLRADGAMCIIIPERESPTFLAAAEEVDLQVREVCRVIPQPASTSVRLLLRFAKGDGPNRRTELLMKDGSGQFTPEYRALLGPYLLRF